MARAVKCVICKCKGDSDSFIKVPKEKGGNSYFCSQEHLDEFEYQELEKRRANFILDYIATLINYNETKLFPTAIRKELNRLRTMYEYNVIYKSLREGSDVIKWKANNDGWNSDWGMTRYIFAVIESKINDVERQMETRNESQKRAEAISNKLVESNIIVDADVDKVTYKPKENKDISNFLEGDDL